MHIRRMWAVTFLPWSKIGRAELRRDGLLEFVGATETPPAGLFAPSWADRPARRRVGEEPESEQPRCCRRLVRRPDRDAGVRLRPASLMSAADVRTQFADDCLRF